MIVNKFDAITELLKYLSGVELDDIGAKLIPLQVRKAWSSEFIMNDDWMRARLRTRILEMEN